MAEGLTPLIPYYSGMGGLYIFYTGRTKIQGTLDEEFLEFLACIIHESLRFVNKHPQQIENLCCGFRQGASYPLKASPEWRPEKAVVEVPRQARESVHAANRDS
jgi:hypothetical protein